MHRPAAGTAGALPTGRTARWRAAGAVAAAAAMLSAMSAIGGGTAGAATVGRPLAPPPVPARGAYLGGFVDPGGAGESAADAGVPAAPVVRTQNLSELAKLGPFSVAIGRPLALVHVYQGWKRNLVSNSVLDSLASTGAIPVIDWNCGDTDANVASGVDDKFLTGYADQLKAYGRPVFLLWYREPNLTLSQDWKNCAQGTASGGSTGPGTGAPGYVAAWRHIWTRFHDAGATNVAFVWNPGLGGDNSPALWQSLYPGAAYVDWLGIDGYSRPAPESPPNPSFTQLFGTAYGYLASTTGTGGQRFYGVKPVMIGETGAVPSNQVAYLQSTAAAVSSGRYPALHAFTYFDSSNLACGHGSCSWALVGPGLSEFGSLARSSYFNPTP